MNPNVSSGIAALHHGRAGLGNGNSRTPKILPVECDICEQNSRSEANPHDRLDRSRAQSLQPGDLEDRTCAEKYQRAHRKTARHPLAVLLDLPSQNEAEGDPGRQHPQGTVSRYCESPQPC